MLVTGNKLLRITPSPAPLQCTCPLNVWKSECISTGLKLWSLIVVSSHFLVMWQRWMCMMDMDNNIDVCKCDPKASHCSIFKCSSYFLFNLIILLFSGWTDVILISSATDSAQPSGSGSSFSCTDVFAVFGIVRFQQNLSFQARNTPLVAHHLQNTIAEFSI